MENTQNSCCPFSQMYSSPTVCILHAWLISAYSECVSHPERRFALGFLLILCVCAWGRDVMVCVCHYSVIQHDSPALEIPALC